jgi:hypothetical protein
LPNYIALRFNLRITHVHRGLLLGTGPLVDPGFQGRLLIPVHNLTDSDYPMDTNMALIWIEFTKTTFGLALPAGIGSMKEGFYGFPEHNFNLKPENYLNKANSGNPIRSSISGFIAETKKETEQANRISNEAHKISNEAKRSARRIEIWGAIVMTLTALGIIVGGFSLLMDAFNLSASVSSSIGALKDESHILEGRISDLQETTKAIRKETSILYDKVNKLEKDVNPEAR